MPKRLLIMSFAAVSLIACNSGFDNSTLVGAWGSPSVQIVAGPAGATLTLPCDVVVLISQRISVDGAGAFAVQGGYSDMMRGSGDTLPAGTQDPMDTFTAPATVSGTVSGDAITLTVTPSGVTPFTVMARRGQPGPSGTAVCRA